MDLLDLFLDRGHGLCRCGVLTVGVGVAFGLDDAASVQTQHHVLVPIERDVGGDVAQRRGAEELVLQLAHCLSSSEGPLQLVVRQVHVEHAPYGDVLEIGYAAAVIVAHLKVEAYHAFLIVQYAYGHAVRSGKQGIRHIAAADAGAQGILLRVVCHEGFAHRFPVVLNRIGVDIGRVAHDLLGLSAEITQHGRVGACELYLHCMACRDREVVFFYTYVRVGPCLPQLAADDGDLLDDGAIVLAVDDKLAVAVSARGHGTYQTVVCGGAALTCGDAFDGGVCGHHVAHLEQAVTHGVGVRGRGEEALDDELFVVEVGEEEVFHARHAEERHGQQAECRHDGLAFVVDQFGDGAAYEAVYGRVHHRRAFVF